MDRERSLYEIQNPSGYECGPASLLVACRILGVKGIKLKDVSHLTQTTSEGTHYRNMVYALHEIDSNLKGRWVKTNLTELTKARAEGYVPIINWTLDGIGHYSVYYSRTKYFAYLYSPEEHTGFRQISLRKLSKNWHDGGAKKWALMVWRQNGKT